MSNILVTGGLGFIGHKVVNYLEHQDNQVTIIDNVSHYGLVDPNHYKKIIAERKKLIKSHNIYYTSINDDWATAGIIAKHSPEIVIHLASAPNLRAVETDSQTAIATMTTGLFNVLRAAKANQVKRFVYISSSMVYGDFNKPASESDCTNPTNIYGIWKRAGEMLVENYSGDKMDYTIIRPSGVYGPSDLPYRAIPRFAQAAINNQVLEVAGRYQRADFTHVDDAAMGIVLAALSDNARNKIYNIASGSANSLYDAAMICVKKTGKGIIQIKDADPKQPKRHALDCSSAFGDLGYSPGVDFETGLCDYISWVEETKINQ